MNSVTYVLYSEDVDHCVLVDCGEYEPLCPILNRIGKKVQSVLLTHGHSDHIYGLVGLLKDFPDIEVYTTEYGHEELKDSRKNLSKYHGYPFTITGYKKRILTNGEYLHFEGLCDVEVIATPGHDTSCLSYKVGNDLFTGDSYLPGLKTFTKFKGGNKQQAEQSLALLTDIEKQGSKIYCGHHDYK